MTHLYPNPTHGAPSGQESSGPEMRLDPEWLGVTLHSIGDAVIAADRECIVAFMNPVAEHLTGWAAVDAVGQPLQSVFHIINEHTRQSVENPVSRALREGVVVGLANHTVLIAKDGTEWAIDDSAAPIRGHDGQIFGVVLVFRDITERKKAERALQESEQRFRALADAAPVLIWMSGPDKEGIYFNQTWLAFTGKPLEQQLDEGWLDLVHPDDRQPLYDVCLEGFRNRQPFTTEFRLRRADGEYRWMLDTGTPRFDAGGAFAGFIGSCVDITDRKQSEEARAMLAAIVESSDDAVVSKALDGTILSWNSGAERIFGYTADEVVGQSITLIVPPELHDEERSILERLRHGERIEHFVTRRIAKDGRELSISLTVSPIRDSQGRIIAASKVARDITSRKRAEEELRESQERLQATFNQAAVGIAVASLNGHFVEVNQRFTEILGYSEDDLRSMTVLEVTHPEDLDETHERMLRILSGEIPHYVMETRYLRKDGAEVWSLTTVTAVKDASGKPQRFISVIEDITYRKRTEQALRAKEAELELVAETTPLILTRCSRDLRYLFANRAAAALFGLTPDQMVGRSIVEVMGEATFAVVKPRIEQVLRGEPVEYEAELPYTGVGPRWVHVNYLPERDERGDVQGWIASIVDITERKAAEAAHLASEERYRAVVESQSEMLCRFRTSGEILFVNGAYARARGTLPHELVGTNFWKFIEPQDQPAVRAMLDGLSPASPEVRIENRFETAEGTRWTLWTNRGLTFDAEGRAAEVQSSGIDITDRKKLEQSLRFLSEASKSLASLVDYRSTLQQVARLAVPYVADWCAVDMLAADGALERLAVAHVDPEKVQLAEELHRRYPPHADSPRGAAKCLRTGEPELVSDISGEMLVEAARDEDHLRILRDLNLKSYMCVPLTSKEKTLGVMSFVSAHSGRRYQAEDLVMAEDLAHRASIAIENAQLYQELREADRRKDQFLAMLAHELRNPLAPIQSALDMLEIDPHRSSHPETIGMMQQQVRHLVRLVDDLLDISRIMRDRIELRKEPTDLSELVKRSVDAMRPQVDQRRQQLFVQTPENPVRMHADPVRLVQVIENLLHNAVKYTDDGGRIDLNVAHSDGEAIVSVHDTGVGIEPELLPKVFDLFAQSSRSLDRAQGGLGIGLTLVRRLVQLHGGTVWAHSKGLGHGSTFTVRLPVVPTAPSAPKQENQTPREAPCRRILVVDDNVAAAKMLSILLAKLGDHEIETAYDGPAALGAIHSSHPDLVLLDIGLPGMDGYAVAKTIRAKQEFDDVMLVALTGYGQEEDRRRSKEAGFDEHLVKPVDKCVLENLLAKQLGKEVRR